MPQTLIILLGASNSDDGMLTADAQSRCDVVLHIIQKDAEARVLPTGAFGHYFNRSNRPHGLYLVDYLRDKGVARDRILPYAPTAGTLEDALFARKVCNDMSVTKVVVVTSDFHMQRTRYIFERLFRSQELEFVSAGTATDTPKERASEEKKLRRLQREWVEIPSDMSCFPSEVYKNASEEQKHYDNLSLAAASGMMIAFSSTYLAKASEFSLGRSVSLLVVAAFVLCLLVIYERACAAARTARRVLRYIEISHGQCGFSTSYFRLSERLGPFSLRVIVHILGIGMAVVLTISACL
jgi:hypothetical protein